MQNLSQSVAHCVVHIIWDMHAKIYILMFYSPTSNIAILTGSLHAEISKRSRIYYSRSAAGILHSSGTG